MADYYRHKSDPDRDPAFWVCVVIALTLITLGVLALVAGQPVPGVG